uniref:Uncharacterized protein n=1 Tax=Triticum urartu TaxID=4572 RepID=A0A8R7PI12_TRIUA
MNQLHYPNTSPASHRIYLQGLPEDAFVPERIEACSHGTHRSPPPPLPPSSCTGRAPPGSRTGKPLRKLEKTHQHGAAQLCLEQSRVSVPGAGNYGGAGSRGGEQERGGAGWAVGGHG